MQQIASIHTKTEFNSSDDYSNTPENLVLAYFSKDLGTRSLLEQESNIDQLKIIVCAFLNRIGGRVYVGIDPETKKVIGIPIDSVDKTITEIHNQCSRISPNPMTISPKINVAYLPIKDHGQHSGKYVIKIYVEPGDRKVIYSTGSEHSYYHRNEEGMNAQFNYQEYQTEYRQRIKGEYNPRLYSFGDAFSREAEDEINSQKIFNLNVAISAFESSTLEYKKFREIGDSTTSSSSTNKRTLVKTICSFLNTSGGRIYIGINDEMKIRGIGPAEASKMKSNIMESLLLISPKPAEKMVEVDILDIIYSEMKVLKVRVRLGEDDQIYSLTFKQFGAYYRNGPCCQSYSMGHYNHEMKLRVGDAFSRVRVKFADEQDSAKEASNPEYLRKVAEYALSNLQHEFVEKWERNSLLEGFVFPKEVRGDAQVNLGLQHARSGHQTETDLAVEFLESGLSNCSEQKKLEAISALVGIYASRNQLDKEKNSSNTVKFQFETSENGPQRSSLGNIHSSGWKPRNLELKAPSGSPQIRHRTLILNTENNEEDPTSPGLQEHRKPLSTDPMQRVEELEDPLEKQARRLEFQTKTGPKEANVGEENLRANEALGVSNDGKQQEEGIKEETDSEVQLYMLKERVKVTLETTRMKEAQWNEEKVKLLERIQDLEDCLANRS